jgi:serine/threonine protein kinase
MMELECFDIGNFIGNGGFAHVFQSYNRTSRKQVALKRIEKSSGIQRARREIEIHRVLNNPHIIQFLESFEDETNIYIILELASMTLFQYLKEQGRFQEKNACFVTAQVLVGIAYLHQHRVVHRDVKLSNILISQIVGEKINVKLCDFGLAIRLAHPDQESMTFCGTPSYMPPEIIANKLPSGFPEDIFALGRVFEALLSGEIPRDNADFSSGLFSWSINANDFLMRALNSVSA